MMEEEPGFDRWKDLVCKYFGVPAPTDVPIVIPLMEVTNQVPEELVTATSEESIGEIVKISPTSLLTYL